MVRGCCLLIILLVAVVAATVFLGGRALAAPDLGAPPGGTAHGGSEVVIAATLAGSAATQLVAGQHAILVLSERDLTVLAAAHDPNPTRYRNPQARVRDGAVLVSTDTSVGPFGATAVVHVALTYTTDGGQPHVTAQAADYTVGQLPLPAWVVDHLVPNAPSTIDLSRLWSSNRVLQLLAQSLECVAVQSDGIHVAFHRPGVTPDVTRCTVAVSP